MDAVATAVKELVLSREALPPVVNVSHPRPVPWSAIAAHLHASLGTHTLRRVPSQEWVRAIEDLSKSCTAQDLERVVRTVFFRCPPEWSCDADEHCAD